MTCRILITCSRTWRDWELAAQVLAAAWRRWPGAVLVSGHARRGDQALEAIWETLGGTVEPHPANWERYGKSAGFRRNAEMVAAGADICLAFIRAGSAGASHTAGLAEQAGIPTKRYTDR